VLTRALLVALVLAVAACAAPASQPPGGEPIPALQGKDPDEAARKSLDAFRALVTADDFRALGFESLDEVAKAQLGPSLKVSTVPLDRLQKFQPGGNPEELLVDANRVIYPITVSEEVRTSLEVGQVGDLWQGRSFGSPEFIRPLAKLRRSDTDFVVWVPALNAYLMASRTEGGLTLTPGFDYPEMDLTAGRTLPAASAFAEMVPLAQSHNGLPN
jgi:hypothetical protein